MHGITYIGYENYAKNKNKYIHYKILRVEWFRELNNFKMVTLPFKASWLFNIDASKNIYIFFWSGYSML